MLRNPEQETKDWLTEVVIKALKAASEKHDRLAEKGLEVVRIKSPTHQTEFVQVLRGDLEAEEAVIETFEDEGVPIRFFSEEHGRVDTSGQPLFLGTLDGIDGSIHYLRERSHGRGMQLCCLFLMDWILFMQTT